MAEQTRDPHEAPDRPTTNSGGRTTDDAPGAEQRSFQTRPGDEESVQHLHPEDEVPAAALQIGGDASADGDDPEPVQPAEVVASEEDMSNDPDPSRADRRQIPSGGDKAG